jgi:hypothetical protein
LSSKDGIVPTAVATAFAQPAVRVLVSTSAPRRLSVTPVEMAEVAA